MLGCGMGRVLVLYSDVRERGDVRAGAHNSDFGIGRVLELGSRRDWNVDFQLDFRLHQLMKHKL